MPEYSEVSFKGIQGLTLFARDYANAGADAPALLCLHGLTRNSSDFAGLARHLCGHYRVICPDQRGRGRSEYDLNPANYQLPTYVGDMFNLLDQLALERVVVVGTSMGGLMGMLMAASEPQRVAGLVLNDIGPEVDPSGLARIGSYVGKSKPVRTWDEAVAQCREINGQAFPDFSDAQWDEFTGGLYRQENGAPVLAYDPAIAQPIDAATEAAVPADLWPLFEKLSLPILALRGAHSDILGAKTVAAMESRGQQCQALTIPNRGHAPTLDEPQSRAKLDAWLSALAL